ncbi:MAG TPA: methyltransferase domain-containing protein [Gemmatimonadaceae bacterium]|nr:methyltransferase domain-containing protein [Gemmatimonadaceae bacterium]
MHSQARYYDLLAWLLTLGREPGFRARLADLARLEPGETVLDVGCGTGTLAIVAKRRVGAAGTVRGIDASPEMIDQARRKAMKAGIDVVFQTGIVEALPFPDAQFDVVLSTLMLHHLPGPVRQQCAREMRRVLKPGGRVLAVDFATPAGQRKGLLARFHRHGHLALRDMTELLAESGVRVVESGSVGVGDLHFALATAPGIRDDDLQDRQAHTSRSLESLPTPRWMFAVLIVALVAGHGIVLRLASTRLALSAVAIAGIIGLLVVTHSRFAGVAQTLFRRRSQQ